MRTIATTLAAMLTMALAASAFGQETKKKPANGVATAVAAVKACAEDDDCTPLRAIQNALADCGLNGLSPRNDSCGTLGGVAAFGIGAQLGLLRGIEVVNLAVRAKDCADGKGFCDAMQTVQTLVDCGLKAATPNACDQVIAEAKAQWPSAKDGDND